jgi:ABC-type oligopeptide transport system substrate-binding subunit
MNKNIIYIVTLVGVLILNLFVLPSAYSTQADFAETTYHRILRHGVFNLDPAVVEESNSLHILLQVAEGLVTYDNNTIAPAVAQRWEVSSDLKEYTFYLNKNAKFSDGNQITTKDVKNSFYNLLRSDSLVWKELSIIKGAEKYHKGKDKVVSGINIISDDIIKIELTKPFSIFLEIIASPPFVILPEQSLLKLKQDKVVSFVSSGPYIVEEYHPNKNIVLKKNINYYAANSVYFTKVIYDFVTDFNKARNDFFSGKYNDIWPILILDNIPETNKEYIKSVPSIAAITWYLIYNLNDKEIKNKALREFISLNLDRAAFLKEMNLPDYYKANHFIPRGLLGHQEYSRKDIPEESISSLLNKIPCTKTKPCTFDVLVQDTYIQALISLFKPLEKYKNVIKINVLGLDRKKYYDRYYSQNYKIIFFGNNPRYFDTHSLLVYFLSEKFHPGIDRSRISDLIQKAYTIMDKKEKSKVYSQIDDEVCNNYNITPIYHGRVPSLYVKKGVTGYYVPILGEIQFKIKHLKKE